VLLVILLKFVVELGLLVLHLLVIVVLAELVFSRCMTESKLVVLVFVVVLSARHTRVLNFLDRSLELNDLLSIPSLICSYVAFGMI
jgi:hypothetical protein